MLFGLFGGMNLQDILITMLYRIPALLIALSFHEFAHAYAAFKLGDPTARNLGRLTLDPFKHLDVIGTLMILLVGYGWAKPVPVNPRNFKKLRRDDTIVSLAGCAANFVLAFLFTGISFLLVRLGVTNTVILTIFDYIVFVNIGIGIFNLLPIPPLDGYHVLKNAFYRVGSRFFWVYERYGIFLLIAIVFSGILGGVLRFLFSAVYTLFANFFGLFL